MVVRGHITKAFPEESAIIIVFASRSYPYDKKNILSGLVGGELGTFHVFSIGLALGFPFLSPTLFAWCIARRIFCRRARQRCYNPSQCLMLFYFLLCSCGRFFLYFFLAFRVFLRCLRLFSSVRTSIHVIFIIPSPLSFISCVARRGTGIE